MSGVGAGAFAKDAFLASSGMLYKIGEIHNGGATMIDCGITITSAASMCAWLEYQINIMHTSG